MKKLVMLVAVAIVATVQASSFKWTATSSQASGKLFYDSSSTQISSALTAYLFDAGTVSQANLLAGLRAGDAITSFTKVATGQVGADAKFTAVDNISYGTTGNTYTFYMAVIKGDEVLISATKYGEAQAADTTTVGFTNPGTWSKNSFADGAFSSAGWYSTTAVPEPTSGLLMLLGIAGLALRRRKA